MTGRQKISVVLSSAEFDRFELYCSNRGYKKSTLIARLIREHLDNEGFEAQAVQSSDQALAPQPRQADQSRKRIARRTAR